MSLYPDAVFIKSANALSQFVADTGGEVAFAGRSNAGKSSAINIIVNRRQFARTSKTPGRTQLVNFFRLDGDRRIVDLPGYGFARVADAMREHWGNLLADYFETRKSLKGLILIVDIRRQLTDFDRQMLQFADSVGLPVHVLLTKADKLSRGAAAASFRKTRGALDERVGMQLFSALDGRGVEEAREVVGDWLTPE